MIEPGAVFEIPASLAAPPQRSHQDNPPDRQSRWVVVVSSQTDCGDPGCRNVLSVLLSTRVDLAGPFDVVTLPPIGGVRRPSIAQTDIVVTVDKRDISGPVNGSRYRGTVLADTIRQIKALMKARMDV